MGLRRAPHVAWRRVGDETVLIHLKTKKIYVLNPTGGFFWHRLDGGSPTELLEGAELPEVPDEAPRELERFLSELERADLLDLERADLLGDAGDGRTSAEPPPYPLSSFVPPELVWQEELRNFGQSCATNSGESAACDAAPTF